MTLLGKLEANKRVFFEFDVHMENKLRSNNTVDGYIRTVITTESVFCVFIKTECLIASR